MENIKTGYLIRLFFFMGNLLFIHCFILYLLMFQYTSIKLPSHRTTHKHKTQTVFYSSRVSFMSPLYRKNRSNSKEQHSSPHKKSHASEILAQKISTAPFHINLMETHEQQRKQISNEGNKNNQKTNSKISFDSKLVKDSLALLSGTDELKKQINRVGKKKNPVHKMLSEYKMVVEKGQREKRKRNSRLHGNLKAYTQQNCLQGQTVDVQQQTHRRKIIKLINSENACHLSCAKQVIQLQRNGRQFYKINELKYEGKEATPGVQFSNQNKWRISQVAQNNYCRKKKSSRHYSQDKSFASLINRDQSIIKRLSHIKKEVELIRAGKMSGNTLFTSKNLMNVTMRGERKKMIEIDGDIEGEDSQIKRQSFQKQKTLESSPKTNSIKYKSKPKHFRTPNKNPEQIQIVVDPWKFDQQEDQQDDNNFSKDFLLK